MINNHAIIYFDGVCNLCNRFVRFIISNDKKGFFRFASLQSEQGRQLLQSINTFDSRETIILQMNGKIYYRSTAALHILRHLDRAWNLLYGFIIVPSFLRDWVYRIVASNRYSWFGRKNECMIPEPGVKERFLD